MRKLFLTAMEKIITLLHSYEFLLQSRVKPTYFSRRGGLGFVNTMQVTLNMNNKSQQMELDSYFELLNGKTLSKQAYSQARQKINPMAFKQMFEVAVGEAVSNKELARYHKYAVLALDGSTVALDNTEELKTFFGCCGAAVNACTARISIACDVLNVIILDAEIAPYAIGERALAKGHIDRVFELPIENPLFIFDRGYVSDDILAKIESNGGKYIMRVRSRWHARLVEDTPSGEWGTFAHEGVTHRVRIIKLTLPSGEQEVLFTNLSEFEPIEFLQLYSMRWPVETKFDCLKNKLQLENFSGKTVIAVLQDFWATMTLSNLAAFVKLETDEIIAQTDQGKELKYKYQTNTNILIGKLKDSLISMMLLNDPVERERLFMKISREIAHNKVPIRPGRSSPRKPPRQKKKFNQCTKPAL